MRSPFPFLIQDSLTAPRTRGSPFPFLIQDISSSPGTRSLHSHSSFRTFPLGSALRSLNHHSGHWPCGRHHCPPIPIPHSGHFPGSQLPRSAISLRALRSAGWVAALGAGPAFPIPHSTVVGPRSSVTSRELGMDSVLPIPHPRPGCGQCSLTSIPDPRAQLQRTRSCVTSRHPGLLSRGPVPDSRVRSLRSQLRNHNSPPAFWTLIHGTK